MRKHRSILCGLIYLQLLLVLPNSEGAKAAKDHTHVNTTSGGAFGIPYNEVTAYFGIPYAEQPEKELRFRVTKPLLETPAPELYQQDVNEDYQGITCPQTQHIPEFSHPSLPQGGVNIQEKCLTLNVYVPNTSNPRSKLAILIWIPGEGFNYADSVQYDGSTLAKSGDIIVVTVNYRVGVFGFMSSGNDTLPGNAGLYDILNAIKWVRKNANAFGGDSNKITLGGRFSGAMAVSALAVSPLFLENDNAGKEKPLTQRVIIHDGIAVGRYVLDHQPMDALEQLANLSHCHNDTLVDTISCLQTIPMERLLNESMKVPQLWKPVSKERLIPEDPIVAFDMGYFPDGLSLLIGDNDGAGSLCYMTHSYLKTNELPGIKDDKVTEKEFLHLIGRSLKEYYAVGLESENLGLVAAHEYQYRGLEIRPSLRDAYLEFCGAMYIRYPVERAARAVAQFNRSTVYRYQWSYPPQISNYPKFLNAAIGEEIIFAFPSNRTNLTGTDRLQSSRFMDMISTFVKSGNPSSTGGWPQFNLVNKSMKNFCEGGLVENNTRSLDRHVHFWQHTITPLAATLTTLMEDVENGKDRVTSVVTPERSVSGQALLAIVISTGLALIVVVVYFFVKNWGKPRSHWRFL